MVPLCISNSLSAEQPLCHADESSALLQFKQTFSIVKSPSSDPSSHPKVASWKLQGDSGDCCSWTGVDCDEDTGHVIGLDLSSSFLHGSINSSSSLFSLVHLQRLNLAHNDFDYSRIPSEISHLSELISLNLSSSVFSGQIPLEISKLSKLVSIDLSFNEDSSFEDSSFSGLLKLEKLGLRSPLQNLTNLKVLRLNDVSISSEVLDTLANLTSLTTLVLENCGLRGEFPINIFYLPNLQVLDVSSNRYLTGPLPEFHPSSPLRQLMLSETRFSGKLPDSIGNLNFLNHLDFSGCYFSGSLPASLGNLTQLNYVELNLYGSIPSVLSNLTQLTHLDLSSNHLSGEIPSHITNLTHLIWLDLSINQLRSPTPRSFSELNNLEYLYLSSNNLAGLDLEIFLMLKNLTDLDLSGNNLTILTKKTSNNTLNKLKMLWFDSCNLTEFPNFLRFQDKLDVLSLGENKIHGEIPAWMLNISVNIYLRNNSLTGFEQHPDILPWDNLLKLDLSYNKLQGPLPIPPLSTSFYSVSHNGLTGELPPLICRLSSLCVLDLSSNNLTGTILPCLSNFSDSLRVLNLESNNFQGPIPHSYNRGNKLKIIDFSDNKLQGKVPRSFASCTKLEILDLSNNLIDDTFPLCLGDLTKLQVLILRSNKFYGAIGNPKIKLELPNLHIIDLSHNCFSGNLPSKYFQNWNAMKFFDVDKMKYMYTLFEVRTNNHSWYYVYSCTMNITNKGVNIEYPEIQNIFSVIDLSSNKFEGEIPESIGNLKGLKMLKISNNDLNGGIPSCLGNLTNLESLDLSQNKLLGEIPQQLALLTFLEFLNVSNNHLTGPIPHGKQFNTFENNSYEGNSGLCGDPLSRKCGKLEAPPTSNSEQDNDSAFPSKVDWNFICTGYVSGIVVGMVIGHTITTRYHEWFIENFGRKQHKLRRKKRRGHGNRS
ncbi:unnamed protein product [Camellia sinensis]